MEFLGASSGPNVASGGSSADGQNGSRFKVQGTGATQFSGAADLLKQVDHLMAKAKTKIVS